MRKAATGDPEYLQAAKLFVGEEQQHATLLLRLLDYLDDQHWSDTVFVRLRRLMGLRTELMVLTVAEVVALLYYGGLAAAGPDSVVRDVAARIVADEHAHVPFQQQRLHAGFGTRVVRRDLWRSPCGGALRSARQPWWHKTTVGCWTRSVTGGPSSSGRRSATSPPWRRRRFVNLGWMQDVSIRDDSIRLGQFLKLAGLIHSGADAKAVIADGLVSVNGTVELRRGRQLRHGDVVAFGDRAATVRLAT